jgi:hypothetical protein
MKTMLGLWKRTIAKEWFMHESLGWWHATQCSDMNWDESGQWQLLMGSAVQGSFAGSQNFLVFDANVSISVLP